MADKEWQEYVAWFARLELDHIELKALLKFVNEGHEKIIKEREWTTP